MKLLDQLPIPEHRTSLRFGDRYVTIHANQILVWVSVHLPGILTPEEKIPRFPALLDTGNNFDFSVQDRHLREWAGVDPDLLDVRGEIEIERQVVTRRGATVWLYPNIAGRQAADSDRPPFRLEMSKGIAVYAKNAEPPGPRLPLLGLPAFVENNLDLWLDPERRQVTVQSRTWRRPLIRLLCRSCRNSRRWPFGSQVGRSVSHQTIDHQLDLRPSTLLSRRRDSPRANTTVRDARDEAA
jgi:hypothetical protein